MPVITIYSTATCPYCVAAKNLIVQRGYRYEEVRVDKDPDQRDLMVQRSGRRTVPQIFVGAHHVGGFDDLSTLDRQGGLAALMDAGNE